MSSVKNDKEDFTDRYNHPTPVLYYQSLMREMNLVQRNEIIAKYSERFLVPMFEQWAKQLGKPLLFLDILSAHGNDTLALTRGYHEKDFEATWASEDTCYNVIKPRMYPVKIWAADLSPNALAFGVKTGIFDEASVMDVNELGAELEDKCKSGNIVYINSLVYLNKGVVEQVTKWFSQGKEPGLLILGMCTTFMDWDEVQRIKQFAVQTLDYFDNVPCYSRKLFPKEVETFSELYGTRTHSLFDYFMLKRRVE